MARSAVGIDVGGGHCRAALVSGEGHILRFADCRTPHDAGAKGLAFAVARLVDSVTRRAPGARGAAGAADSPRDAEAAGIALPGLYDSATGVMGQAVNLPFLQGVNIRDAFSAALGRPVAIESDVHSAGWAQYTRLSNRPKRLLYLSLGTGVGGCVIADGRILREVRGLGHVVVDASPGAALCRCGDRGCLEALASGPAIDAARAAAATPDTDAGWSQATNAIATACRQFIALYSLELILLGGGVIDAHTRLAAGQSPAPVDLAKRVSDAMKRHGSTLIPSGLTVDLAPLRSNEAGVIGAALLAMH